MRTIDTLRRYNLSKYDENLLTKLWWYNWCGWKWSINFSKLVRNNIEIIDNFDSGLGMQLWEDIEVLCFEHDLDFGRGGTLFDFYRANIIFGYKLYKLLHKLNRGGRISVSIIVIVVLNKHWKEKFKFWEKRSLKFLLNNKNVW